MTAKRILATLAACLGAVFLFGSSLRADEQVNPYATCPSNGCVQVVGPFGGLDTFDSPQAVPSNMAQSLLNVDLDIGGRSVKSRPGYGLFQTLFVSSGPVHGGYHFSDSAGNDYQLWANDHYLSVSKNGGAFTTLVSTWTLNSTVQCTDAQGIAYCFDSNADTPISTNGSTLTWLPNVATGTMCTSSAGRLFVAGVSGNLSTIYASQAGAYTNFVINSALQSSAWTELVLSPGHGLTHIRYVGGYLYWWKDQSFGYIVSANNGAIDFPSTNLQIITISDTVGTLDNSSVYYNGIIYFRGQDNHIWQWDGSALQRSTQIIGPSVTTANTRKSNSWTVNTTAGFALGSTNPDNSLVKSSTQAIAGAVVVSSAAIQNFTDQLSADFGGGTTFTNVSTTTVPNAVVPSTSNSNVTNNDFEFGPTGIVVSSWTLTLANSGDIGTNTGSFYSITGAFSGSDYVHVGNEVTGAAISSFNVALLDANQNTITSQAITTGADSGGWGQKTFGPLSSYVGKYAQLQFNYTQVQGGTTHSGNIISQPFIVSGSSITFYIWDACSGGVCSNGETVGLDLVQGGVSTITSGTFVSRAFNTKVSAPTWLPSSYTYITNGNTVLVSAQVSSDGNTWDSTATWTSGSAPTSANKQYVRYRVDFSTNGNNATGQPQFSFANLLPMSSTATWYSGVNNAPNLTSWGTFTKTDLPAGGTLTYYMRAATNTFTVTSATPTWVAQTPSATVAPSTGTYFQTRVDFAVGTSTVVPEFLGFTANWFEGNAADKAYGFYFDNGIWWSVSTGNTTTNNTIFRLDLLNSAWLKYNIPMNGMLFQNNSLYFGDPLSGKIYKYAGGALDDNGVAINSFWQSKDFILSDPFTEKNMNWISVYAGATTLSVLNMSYAINRNAATTYTINLYDSIANTVINNVTLASGTYGRTINFQIGNNPVGAGAGIDQPWEVFAIGLGWTPRPWRVYPPPAGI